ncbi:Aste57867_2596 [Aphanomyces stellatus]|uniref:RING-type E3 ubiquitin transferase n=1 Tax=Aphanomyces stellatus TaxID=120398 RepID=A0A485K7Y5_9STRA|nr:hypothetical protein As57867_002589 [Aphanomyces stellatus]VFT79792.1 Aste57867_2596 [Aphanomyces stellatus]
MSGRSRFFKPPPPPPAEPGKGDTQQSSPPTIEPSSCAICLGSLQNRTLLVCTHAFCHPCILEWSKVSTTCPLCKTPFEELWNAASRKATSVPTVSAVDYHVLEPVLDAIPSFDQQDDMTHGYDVDDGFVVPDDFVEFDNADLDLLEMSSAIADNMTASSRLRLRRRRRLHETASDDDEAEEEEAPVRHGRHRRLILDDDNDDENGGAVTSAPTDERRQRRSKYFS